MVDRLRSIVTLELGQNRACQLGSSLIAYILKSYCRSICSNQSIKLKWRSLLGVYILLTIYIEILLYIVSLTLRVSDK